MAPETRVALVILIIEAAINHWTKLRCITSKTSVPTLYVPLLMLNT